MTVKQAIEMGSRRQDLIKIGWRIQKLIRGDRQQYHVKTCF
jgi:hypothetical protein